MPKMAAKKTKKRTAFQQHLAKIQEDLGLSNEEMSRRLRISLRLYISWKYGERNPSQAGLALVSFLREKKI